MYRRWKQSLQPAVYGIVTRKMSGCVEFRRSFYKLFLMAVVFEIVINESWSWQWLFGLNGCSFFPWHSDPSLSLGLDYRHSVCEMTLYGHPWTKQTCYTRSLTAGRHRLETTMITLNVLKLLTVFEH